ncbi:hypothetical protein [Mucilaginibacter sp. HD30]
MQLPTQAGEICQILHPIDDENPGDVYIIAEDPAPFDSEDEIYLVNLRDLQRNINSPAAAPQIQVVKSGVNVIAANLEEYINSWNKLKE